NEMRAADLVNPRHLLLLGLVKINVVCRKTEPCRIVEAVLGEKGASRLVQVVPGAEKGIARAMANDEHFLADASAVIEKIQHSRKQAGPTHARAVDVALQL